MTFTPPDVRHLPLPVLHSEATFAVVVKPAGLLSIPGRSPDAHDSVAVRVMRAFPDARGPIVAHRLDMATSGVMVVALTAEAHRTLSVAFQEHRVRKTYVALVEGVVDGEGGVVDLPLRPDLDRRPLQVVDRAFGRPCVTRWRVLSREPGCTRLELEPLTGRTHQLRVHAAAGLGHAIVGDRLYGREGERLMLHAETLELAHPETGVVIRFSASAPF